MSNVVISVENLSKSYRLGQIGTGTLANDLNVWWAKLRGKPNPMLRIGQTDHSNRDGETLWALKDVSFKVEQGEVLGVIGRNGAGKSTLLKILSRVTAPTGGCVKVKGRIASLLEVGTGFHPELTGRENIYLNGAILGMTKQEVTRKFDEIVAFAEVEKFIDTPVKRYSSGMYVRLAFAVAAHLESEILLVDEVLAVGDAEFQKKCLGKMGDVATNEGRTVLFVSHNMAAVEKLCVNAILFQDGKLHINSNVNSVIDLYLNQSLTNKKSYSSGPVKYAEIIQTGKNIQISITYKLQPPILFPNLGYVISDHYGTKIFGSNSIIDGLYCESEPVSDGTVCAIIDEPKLLNGKYKLSLWFGDRRGDIFTDIEGFEFEVVNMAGLNQASIQATGFIHPKTRWIFNENK